MLPAVAHGITHRRLRIHPVRIDAPLPGGSPVERDDLGRLTALFRKVALAVLEERPAPDVPARSPDHPGSS